LLKNKIFIIIMAIVLSLIVIYNIRFFSQRKRMKNLSPATKAAEETLNLVKPRPRIGKDSLPAKKEPLSPFWGRNPFLLSGEEKLGKSFFLTSPSEEKTPTIETPENKQKENEWSLTAILFSDTSSLAIINHEIVKEGDTLAGGKVKVIKIMPEKVILGKEKETFILQLGIIVPQETNLNEEEKK